MGVEVWLALGSIVLNIVVAAVGLTWGIAKLRDAIRDEIDEHRDQTEHKIDTLRLNVGEMGTALRTKISEVELFSRDTFMRRDSFYKTIEMLSADLKAQFIKMDSRLDRMENKLDATKTKLDAA